MRVFRLFYGPLEKGPSTFIAGVCITGVSNVKTGSQSPPPPIHRGGGGGVLVT